MNTSSDPNALLRPSAVSGVLPHGAGFREPDPGDLVGLPGRLEAGQHLVGAAGHVLRGDGLGRLGAHLAAWVCSAAAFFSALARSRRRRFSSVARASR